MNSDILTPPKTSFKVPATAAANEVDRESVQIKSLGFWMSRDVKSGNLLRWSFFNFINTRSTKYESFHIYYMPNLTSSGNCRFSSG